MEGNDNTLVVGDPLVRDLFGSWRFWKHLFSVALQKLKSFGRLLIRIGRITCFGCAWHCSRVILDSASWRANCDYASPSGYSKYALFTLRLSLSVDWFIDMYILTIHSTTNQCPIVMISSTLTSELRTLSQRNLGGNSLSIEKVVHMNSEQAVRLNPLRIRDLSPLERNFFRMHIVRYCATSFPSCFQWLFRWNLHKFLGPWICNTSINCTAIAGDIHGVSRLRCSFACCSRISYITSDINISFETQKFKNSSGIADGWQ